MKPPHRHKSPVLTHTKKKKRTCCRVDGGGDVGDGLQLVAESAEVFVERLHPPQVVADLVLPVLPGLGGMMTRGKRAGGGLITGSTGCWDVGRIDKTQGKRQKTHKRKPQDTQISKGATITTPPPNSFPTKRSKRSKPTQTHSPSNTQAPTTHLEGLLHVVGRVTDAVLELGHEGIKRLVDQIKGARNRPEVLQNLTHRRRHHALFQRRWSGWQKRSVCMCARVCVCVSELY